MVEVTKSLNQGENCEKMPDMFSKVPSEQIIEQEDKLRDSWGRGLRKALKMFGPGWLSTSAKIRLILTREPLSGSSWHTQLGLYNWLGWRLTEVMRNTLRTYRQHIPTTPTNQKAHQFLYSPPCSSSWKLCSKKTEQIYEVNYMLTCPCTRVTSVKSPTTSKTWSLDSLTDPVHCMSTQVEDQGTNWTVVFHR